MLSPADHDYVSRRRKFLNHLGPVSIGLCIAWAACLVFMVIWNPQVMNPLTVAEGLREGTLTSSQVRALALMAPGLYICVVVVITLSLYTYIRGAFRERRLLELVERAERGSVSPP